VERIFKGDTIAANRNLVFSFVGGRAGDTAVVTEDLEIYKPGTRIIVFLHRGQPGNPAYTADPAGLFPSWALVIDGQVARGEIRDIPLGELVRQIQRGQ
jgi:hypothetical protein